MLLRIQKSYFYIAFLSQHDVVSLSTNTFHKINGICTTKYRQYINKYINKTFNIGTFFVQILLLVLFS